MKSLKWQKEYQKYWLKYMVIVFFCFYLTFLAVVTYVRSWSIWKKFYLKKSFRQKNFFLSDKFLFYDWKNGFVLAQSYLFYLTVNIIFISYTGAAKLIFRFTLQITFISIILKTQKKIWKMSITGPSLTLLSYHLFRKR